MRRREFVILFGSASALAIPAWAQHGEPVRRIGMLMPFREDHAEGFRRLKAVRDGLQQLGWKEGVVEKWLELLKEMAPATNRVLFVYAPETSPGGGVNFLRIFEAACRALELTAQGAPVIMLQILKPRSGRLNNPTRGSS
jgi:hypothetical protein